MEIRDCIKEENIHQDSNQSCRSTRSKSTNSKKMEKYHQTEHPENRLISSLKFTHSPIDVLNTKQMIQTQLQFNHKNLSGCERRLSLIEFIFPPKEIFHRSNTTPACQVIERQAQEQDLTWCKPFRRKKNRKLSNLYDSNFTRTRCSALSSNFPPRDMIQQNVTVERRIKQNPQMAQIMQMGEEKIVQSQKLRTKENKTETKDGIKILQNRYSIQQPPQYDKNGVIEERSTYNKLFLPYKIQSEVFIIQENQSNNRSKEEQIMLQSSIQNNYQKKSVELLEYIQEIKQDIYNGKQQEEQQGKNYQRKQTIQQNEGKFKKSDFEIGKKMGNGIFGDVYVAKDKKTGFLVALKMMEKKKLKMQNYVNQVSRQIQIQSFLKHKNIAELYGVFDDQEYIFLILEFCTDGNLYSTIRKEKQLDQCDTVRVVKEICQGTASLHEEMVIHRDLKPENVMLCFGTPKITDFGWAVYRGKDGGMRDTQSGSPLYHSPQIVNRKYYDDKVDAWAIGLLTYQCLIGIPPFKVYSIFNMNRIVQDQVKFPPYIDISEDAKYFILKCLEKNPQKRIGVDEMLKHPFLQEIQ